MWYKNMCFFFLMGIIWFLMGIYIFIYPFNDIPLYSNYIAQMIYLSPFS